MTTPLDFEYPDQGFDPSDLFEWGPDDERCDLFERGAYDDMEAA